MFFFFKQKTAYEMRISDWSSDVAPSDLDDAHFAKQATTTPQTASAAYRLAFQDTDFLLRDDLRPVRFQLELLKPELLLEEAKIESTLVIYGSARIPEADTADGLEAAATDDAARQKGGAAEGEKGG